MVQNGIVSGLPYILMWIVAMGSGFLVDSMATSRHFTVTCVRKTFVTIGKDNGQNVLVDNPTKRHTMILTRA